MIGRAHPAVFRARAAPRREEYRLHAIVFTLRGTSTFVFNRVWPPIEDPARPGHYGSDAQARDAKALASASASASERRSGRQRQRCKRTRAGHNNVLFANKQNTE